MFSSTTTPGQNNKVSNAEHANTTDTIVFYGSKGYDTLKQQAAQWLPSFGDDEIPGGFNTKLDVTGDEDTITSTGPK